MANGLRAAPSIRVEDASGRPERKRPDQREQQPGREVERPSNYQEAGSRKIIKTKTQTTTTETRTTTTSDAADTLGRQEDPLGGAKDSSRNRNVGQRSSSLRPADHIAGRTNQSASNLSHNRRQQATDESDTVNDEFDLPTLEGNKLVTTVSTIGAQCGQSRLVLALLKEGDKLYMKVQEMRPPIFEVGFNSNECNKYHQEHQKMLANLKRQEKSPIEAWLKKYQKIRASEGNRMSAERQLIYLCMLENLQACWRASLRQLDKRAQLLEMACKFYELAEEVSRSIELAENHVQSYRSEFLNGPGSKRFHEARSELCALNKGVLDSFDAAKRKQQQLIELIRLIASNNLGDARVNHLISDAQNLINYIGAYLDPLQKRRLQLESVLKTTSTSSSSTTITTSTIATTASERGPRGGSASGRTTLSQQQRLNSMREINNLNDLHFVDNWLSLKIEQLNSSLLSSLGVGVLDSRTILSKHEQILLECRTIEEATLLFGGKNIHAIKPHEDPAAKEGSLFEQQRKLSSKVGDVITILEARIALLRRTIDFHVRSKEATGDIGKMMRRLQVDNSLQSVEFVANELELKDFSSVVASGATIISELQQLQLAQQHGQRSNLINLNLVTSGIRTTIDQLNQELAHLKTVLNQRKLILLNEDATKMATNFNQKCNQLHFWLQNHVKSFLLANNQVPLDLDGAQKFLLGHQQLRLEVQRKTLEVEALLRSLSSLGEENFDAKGKLAETIQRSVDELRQEWILVTNCLEQRTEVAKKYLALLELAEPLDGDLQLVQNFRRGLQTSGELPDEANIRRALQQLARQLQLLRAEVQKGATQLVCQEPSNRQQQQQVNELNGGQLLEQAENLLVRLTARERSLFEGRPRPQQRQAAAPAPAPSFAPSKPTDSLQQQQQQQQQPQQPKPDDTRKPAPIEPPKFKQALGDKWAMPFSPVELECELVGGDQFGHTQLEWLMNNFRKIPATIRHSTSSDGHTKHKLTIHHFGPQCCGTYLARAWNSAGQTVSRCELRLAGMGQPRTAAAAAPTSNRGDSSHLLAHRWPPANRAQEPIRQPASAEKQAMARIVQGVESLGQKESTQKDATTTTTTTTAATTTTTTLQAGHKLPVVESRYSLNESTGCRQQTGDRSSRQSLAVVQPGSSVSSSGTLSRSISRSPFEGTPQPPRFVQPVCQSMSPCCSRAGLLCVVVANPPPTIEWLHNNQTVALAKCPPRDRSISSSAGNNTRGNICKLTIETVNDQTSGEYTCRASNRMGETSSNFRLLN